MRRNVPAVEARCLGFSAMFRCWAVIQIHQIELVTGFVKLCKVMDEYGCGSIDMFLGHFNIEHWTPASLWALAHPV